MVRSVASDSRWRSATRATATRPTLLLLDEVFAGLTPSEARQGSDLVRRVREKGITVVMVEHVMEVVMPLVEKCDDCAPYFAVVLVPGWEQRR